VTTPGVEALARALDSVTRVSIEDDHGVVRSERDYRELTPQGLLAALSPADRLAIAGITEERLAAALERAWPKDGLLSIPQSGPSDALIAAILASLATPVTPEGGEL
jgi:hypothetical protein